VPPLRVPRTTILPDRGIHFPLPTLARLLVVTVLAKVRQYPGLLALLLEALERALEVLIVMDDDFRQTDSPPFAAFVRQLNVMSH
jgi:hypothetical protein